MSRAHFTAYDNQRRAEATSCWEHYQAVVRLIDNPEVIAGLTGVDRADIYLEQLKGSAGTAVYSTTLDMVGSHYGISWQAIRRGDPLPGDDDEPACGCRTIWTPEGQVRVPHPGCLVHEGN